MGYALKLYEAFREYGEDKARLIAEAFDELEKRYPQIREITTRTDLSETELKLTKEIENTRKEIKEVELKLTKEIENTRKEIKALEIKLTKDIKELELKLTKEIQDTRKEIKEVETRLVRWMFMFWTGQVIALIGILKWIIK
jgi:hypothetical protein